MAILSTEYMSTTIQNISDVDQLMVEQEMCMLIDVITLRTWYIHQEMVNSKKTTALGDLIVQKYYIRQLSYAQQTPSSI